jgi:hypothetical protein
MGIAFDNWIQGCLNMIQEVYRKLRIVNTNRQANVFAALTQSAQLRNAPRLD